MNTQFSNLFYSWVAFSHSDSNVVLAIFAVYKSLVLTPSQPCRLYQGEKHFVVVETSHKGQHMNLLTDERCSKIASLWKLGTIMSERASSRRCQALPNDKTSSVREQGTKI